MIRVLLVPSSDYLGHPTLQRYHHLFERLHCDDVEVHVVRFPIYRRSTLRRTNLVVHEFPIEVKITRPLAGYYLMNMPIHALWIKKMILQEGIDVVVMGNLSAPFGYTVLRQLTGAKVPVIFDLQDHYPTSAAGYLANIFTIGGNFASRCLEAMLTYIIRHARVITAASHALVDYAHKRGAKKVLYLPNGTSEEFLVRQDRGKIREKLGYDDDDIVVGHVGSVEFWLDMLPLIEGIGRVRQQGVPVKLLLIGESVQTGYSNTVLQWIERNGVGKITTWMGFVPHDQVVGYIAAMDIGTMPFNPLHPTAYYAGPIKLWEYLSQNKPVLSTPIPESIRYREYVDLVKTPDDYAGAISRYARDPVPFLEKARRGMQRARRMTWKKIARNLRIIFERLERDEI